jgi:hypothetical protein
MCVAIVTQWQQYRRQSHRNGTGPRLVHGALAFWMQNIGTAEDRHRLPRPLRVSTVAQG